MAIVEKPAETLPLLTAALISTAEAHDAASRDARIARSRETSALNDMNKAQRDFDAFVAKMKQNAPRDSDWKRGDPRGGPSA